MKYNSISEVFDAFKGLKVLIIGDVMVDAYIHGLVSRISPEAPVPVMNVTSRENRLGGAANVALNIQSLGADPILCSLIGDDLAANDFFELLNKRGMSTKGIIRSQKRMTTVKNRVISGGHHLIRIDEEEDQPLDHIDEKSLIAHIKQLIEECDVVIFEDYDKGCLNENIIAFAIAEANKKGIPTAVDPKKRNFLSYKNATLFKPNLKELNEGLKLEIDAENVDEVKNAVDTLNQSLHCTSYVITLSENGIYFQDAKNHNHHVAHLRTISDVSGAGDTVISIAALGLALKLPIQFWSELANLGGGIVCEYSGVVPVDIERLKAEAVEDPSLLEALKAN